MKLSSLILMLGMLSACAAKPVYVMEYGYGGAKAEIYRAGTPIKLQATCKPEEMIATNNGMLCPDGSGGSGSRVVTPYDQVSHTCTTFPTYDINGQYNYTQVVCN